MSRTKLITLMSIAVIITAVYYGYLFYLHSIIKVFPVNKSVQLQDIMINIDEVSLVPRLMLKEPFRREITVKGSVTDTSPDGKYTRNLPKLVKVYVKGGPGMGFGHNIQANNYSFWTFRIYDGNNTVELFIEDDINQQKIPLTIDLHNYNSHWVKRS